MRLAVALLASVSLFGAAKAQSEDPVARGLALSAKAATVNTSNSLVTATGSTTARTLAARAAEVINVKDYGAQGNTLTLTDGTVSANSTAFTSASASFTSADVGKLIQIDGGNGISSAPFITTISAVTGTHAVTLASAATSATPAFNLPVVQQAGISVNASRAAGSYVPSDVLTLTGGTSSIQASVKVMATKVVAATIASAGSGGTASATCNVSGSTGKGVYFVLNVTLNGSGALSTVNSISQAGAYYTNPNSVSAEPVTNPSDGSCGGLSGATVNLTMGVLSVTTQAQGGYSNVPSSPVSTGAGSISGATGATVTPNWNTTGTFTYGNDDTSSISAAVSKANSNAALSVESEVYFPVGRYFINGALTHFNEYVNGRVRGAGDFKTYLVLSPNFTGSVFTWDNAWGTTSYLQSYLFPRSVNGFSSNGGSLKDLTITGDLSSTNPQNGVTLIDVDDMFQMENVSFFSLNGYCGSLGNTTSDGTLAIVRESRFNSVRCFDSGTSSAPAFIINTMGASDGTNELRFNDLDFYNTRSTALAIWNNSTSGPTRLINFYGLRAETTQPNSDLIDIGNASGMGSSIYGVHVYGLEINGVPGGGAGLRLTSDTNGHAPYDISADGTITYGNGVGVEVDQTQSFGDRFNLSIATMGTNVVVGSNVTGPIYLDANGQEQFFTTNINGQSAQYVRTPSYKFGSFGSPSAGGVGATYNNPSVLYTSILANVHRGGATDGNAPGGGANDLQTSRTSATQVASGAYSVITGGLSNTASGSVAVVSGGTNNTASNFGSTVLGGQFNNASGDHGTIMGGSNNTDSGGYSLVGGIYGSDNSSTGGMFLGGKCAPYAAPQGCGWAVIPLGGIASSTTAIELTSDGNGSAAGAHNCVNIPLNTGWKLSIDAVAVNNGGNANIAAWNSVDGILYRNSGNAIYSGGYSSSSAPSISNGTGSTARLQISADTTNQCLNVSFSAPDSSGWQATATVKLTMTW